MRNRKYSPILSASLTLIVASLACTGLAAPAATSTATTVPVTPTATTRPTSTPRPTATPDVTATRAAEELSARIDNYAKQGYISTTEGQLHPLDDYSLEWAKIDYFSDYTSIGYHNPVKDFVYIADYKWESAVPNPETSGCGLFFRLKDNGDFYSVYLDAERVVVGGAVAAFGPYVTRFGVTSGTGRVKLGNPAQANFVYIMNGYKGYALVNDEFIGSYTLYSGKLLDPGYMGYFVKSGTNKDYGTRCEITNAKLWIPGQ